MAIKKQPPRPAAREPAFVPPKPAAPSPMVPCRNLPVWNHAEYGRWKPVFGPPMDDAEMLYWTEMTRLVFRKWPQVMGNTPLPALSFARMRPADGTDQWCSIDILLMEKPPGTDLSPFLAALRDDNLFSFMDCGRYAYASPFFEWGLADYWENGYYDR